MNGRYFDEAEQILSKFDFYSDYRNNLIDSKTFRQLMAENKNAIRSAGIDEWNFGRFLLSPSGNRDIEKMLEDFKKQGAIDTTDYGVENFRRYQDFIKPFYDNSGFITAIFPEDELLMYAAASITKPKRMFIGGSYFGYWAIWAMEAVKKSKGFCTLSDINPAVVEISKRNMKKFGFEDYTNCSAEDAERLLLGSDEPIDLLALDATGAHDDPRPTHRGKALYAALLSAARHRLYSGSYIIIHNLERENEGLAPLIKILDEITCAGVELMTYNGLGLYKVR